jgi:tripeptidyl-peptidase-2
VRGKHTDIQHLFVFARFVYDSVVEAEMYMLYDSNQQLLSVGDIYPAEATLEKGDHTIKLMLRHDDTAILEKLRDLPMLVERKLKDPISVPIYPTNSDAVAETNAIKEFVLRKGSLPSQAVQKRSSL